MEAADGALALEVTDVRAEARDVLAFELRRRDGRALPEAEPGAHIEIELSNGLIRHYSLLNDRRERDRYVIAVGLAPNSGGGSAFMHRNVRCGTTLVVRAIRNNFPLDRAAGRFLFLAGGIGITPILSMVRWCEANGREWRLIYAARTAQHAAFAEALRAHGGKVRFHFDDRRGGVLDVGPPLAGVGDDEQVYCCGPAPMMAAVKEAGLRLPAASLHFEYFTAPADQRPAPSGGFTVVLRRSGREIAVPSGKSILEAIEESGLAVPFSCREGMCRTCETGFCEGEVEHRDYVLSDEERKTGTTMMLCVSRATSDVLVLDL